MRPDQHVIDPEMQFSSGLEKSQDFTSKVWSWKEFITFISFPHSADHTSSQFKSKQLTVLHNIENNLHVRNPVKQSWMLFQQDSTKKGTLKNQVFSKWDLRQEFTVKLCQVYTATNNFDSVEYQKTYLHWIFVDHNWKPLSRLPCSCHTFKGAISLVLSTRCFLSSFSSSDKSGYSCLKRYKGQTTSAVSYKKLCC